MSQREKEIPYSMYSYITDNYISVMKKGRTSAKTLAMNYTSKWNSLFREVHRSFISHLEHMKHGRWNT